MDDEAVLIRAGASQPRRAIATLILGMLGALLLLVAADAAMTGLWRGVYSLCGLGAMFLSYRLWQATGDMLELTREELRTASGRRLARVENVESVDRGAFAFKPSNGFIVRLKSAEDQRAWAPGLWWRIGRRIGVGGVVAAGQAKAMAEVLTAINSGTVPKDSA
ncbi:MAG: hypothetical protein AAF762_07450 [Pseudomonadota bacterium]